MSRRTFAFILASFVTLLFTSETNAAHKKEAKEFRAAVASCVASNTPENRDAAWSMLSLVRVDCPEITFACQSHHQPEGWSIDCKTLLGDEMHYMVVYMADHMWVSLRDEVLGSEDQ